jgi:hypothetical protein
MYSTCLVLQPGSNSVLEYLCVPLVSPCRLLCLTLVSHSSLNAICPCLCLLRLCQPLALVLLLTFYFGIRPSWLVLLLTTLAHFYSGLLITSPLKRISPRFSTPVYANLILALISLAQAPYSIALTLSSLM